MKNLFPLLCAALSLSACMSIESEISACPAHGLSGATFTAGKPPGGTVIPMASAENGDRTWDLTGGKKDLYLTCHYSDGGTRLQRLPSEMQACTLTPGGNLSCKSYI